MKRFILLILIVIANQSLSQGKGSFGVGFGFLVPHLAAELRFSYLITNRLEVNLGLDGNAIRTLGRLGGVKYQFYQSKKSNKSLFFGCEFDNSSKGVYSVHDELTGNSGAYSIPNNEYFTPQIGFRSFGQFTRFDDAILKIGNGGSIEIIASYRIPINYRSPYFRNGYFTDDGLNAVSRFVNGGFNVSVRFGLWFKTGASKNRTYEN
ncbi:MAG: hypothetical protein IT222_00805 [Crocinitomix sp.]|nr:hypothetical protein [Crocinitomix sp.]